MHVSHDRSLGDLFSDLSQQTADLIRQEMRLAKAELSENLAGVGRHAMMIGLAMAFGLAALMSAAAAMVLLMIEAGLEPWLAATITAVVMGLSAYVLAQSGVSALRKTTIAPVETIHSLKETTQWLKHPTR